MCLAPSLKYGHFKITVRSVTITFFLLSPLELLYHLPPSLPFFHLHDLYPSLLLLTLVRLSVSVHFLSLTVFYQFSPSNSNPISAQSNINSTIYVVPVFPLPRCHP